MRNYVAVLLVVTLLAGCNPAYQRPTSPDIARIRFVPVREAGFLYSMSAYVHTSDDCGTPKKIFSLGGGPFNFGGGKQNAADMGIPKNPAIVYANGQYYETAIEGGRPFYFSVTGGQQGGVCYLTGSFAPLPGSDYEVTYKSDQSSCYLKVERLDVRDGHIVVSRELTAKQRPTACTFFWN